MRKLRPSATATLPAHYCYSSSDVLKNKYGIKNKRKLKEKCAHDATREMVNLRQELPPEQVNSDYLKYLHYCIFRNTYEWAGHTRDEPFTFSDGSTAHMPILMKKNSDIAFTLGDEIQEKLQQFDQTLIAWNYLRELPYEQFVDIASQMYAYLNSTRPFVEGNERTQRAFFEKLAEGAGYQLDFSVVTQKRMNVASNVSIEEGDIRPLKYIFEEISHPKKIRLLKEVKDYMEFDHSDNLQDRFITIANEGEVYTGIYLGSRAHGFTIDVNGVHVVGEINHLTPEQIKTLSPGDKFTFTAPMNKDLEKILIPKEKLAPLTKEEMLEKINTTVAVHESQTAIKSLLKTVYGKSNALDIQLDMVKEDPRTGPQFVEAIMQNPFSVDKIAGFQICGIKNNRRREAEDAFAPLCEALTDYVDVVTNTRRNILRHHKTEQTRLAKQVKMPSEELLEVLSLPKEERQEILGASHKLRSELYDLVWKVNHRLSQNERLALNNDNVTKIATSIGISMEKAMDVTQFCNFLQQVSQEQTQLARLNRSKNMAMAS
ncbi:BID domain-containing T4SS effector [Bartonella sp. cb54]|uniref:BID domain-containing T4SS effector n=1 Tax=Bartonella sp. cb54 TaxID=3385560 RepID=UPI0039A5DA13